MTKNKGKQKNPHMKKSAHIASTDLASFCVAQICIVHTHALARAITGPKHCVLKFEIEIFGFMQKFMHTRN